MNPYQNNDLWENYDKMQPYIEPARATTQTRFQVNSVTDGIIVPGLKSLILAVPAGLLAGLIIGAFGVQVNVWYSIGITTLFVFLFVFWKSSVWWNNTLEKLLGADLNRDGRIGTAPILQPPLVQAQPETVVVHLTKNEGQEGAFIPLPYPEKIPVLAQTILEGRAYSQSALVAGGILKRDEYETIKDAMLSAGLMRYKNPDAPNAGIVVTSAGRAVLRRFLPVKALPSPTNDGE